MNIREEAIARIQTMPEPLLSQVLEFMDGLADDPSNVVAEASSSTNMACAWKNWFASVEALETMAEQPVSPYQQILIDKYRKQGLDL